MDVSITATQLEMERQIKKKPANSEVDIDKKRRKKKPIQSRTTKHLCPAVRNKAIFTNWHLKYDYQFHVSRNFRWSRFEVMADTFIIYSLLPLLFVLLTIKVICRHLQTTMNGTCVCGAIFPVCNALL